MGEMKRREAKSEQAEEKDATESRSRSYGFRVRRVHRPKLFTGRTAPMTSTQISSLSIGITLYDKPHHIITFQRLHNQHNVDSVYTIDICVYNRPVYIIDC